MKKSVIVAVLMCAALFVSCGQSDTKLKMGDKSKMDTLSYALGSNVAMGLSYQMGDVPFDMALAAEGFTESALGKASLEPEEAVEMLRDYFTNKHDSLAMLVSEKRAAADSARLAQGDSTRYEWPAADEAMFESEAQREEISYALGVDLGNNIAKSGMPLQVYWVATALEEVYAKQGRMNEMQVMQYLQNYFTVVVPAENAAASAEWMEEMAKKSGVEKTESGLCYKIIEAGDPNIRAINDEDVVTVHYTGRLRTGEVFDSSIFANLSEEEQQMRKQYNPALGEGEDTPATFPLNRVIKGWTEGMKLVGKGGKIILYIPAEMAYGLQGAGRAIGPNEALEFEVEVLDVEVAPIPAAEEAEEEVTEQ